MNKGSESRSWVVTRCTIIEISSDLSSNLMQVDTFFNTFIVCDQGLLLINPRNIISNIIMLLNINATRAFILCFLRY